MNKEKIKAILQDILSEVEIRTYLTALAGPMKVSDLAKKAGLDRTNSYKIIKNLVDKGLLIEEVKTRGRLIIPEHPKKVAQLIGRKQRLLRRHELEWNELMPEILADYNVGDLRPKVRFYEGEEGYYNICEETLNSGEKDLLQIGNLTELHKVISQDYDLSYYAPKRVKIGMHTRIIIDAEVVKNSKAIQVEIKHNKEHLRQIKYLPKEFLFNAYKYVYKDKVAIISSEKELISMVIESKAIADMERKIFDFFWQKL